MKYTVCVRFFPYQGMPKRVLHPCPRRQCMYGGDEPRRDSKTLVDVFILNEQPTATMPDYSANMSVSARCTRLE